MKALVLIELAGGNSASAVRHGISDLVSLIHALESGEIRRVQGIGTKNYTVLCRLFGLPEPVFRNGKLVKTPALIAAQKKYENGTVVQ